MNQTTSNNLNKWTPSSPYSTSAAATRCSLRSATTISRPRRSAPKLEVDGLVREQRVRGQDIAVAPDCGRLLVGCSPSPFTHWANSSSAKSAPHSADANANTLERSPRTTHRYSRLPHASGSLAVWCCWLAMGTWWLLRTRATWKRWLRRAALTSSYYALEREPAITSAVLAIPSRWVGFPRNGIPPVRLTREPGGATSSSRGGPPRPTAEHLCLPPPPFQW